MSDDEFVEKQSPVRKAKYNAKKERYGALIVVLDCGSTMCETDEGRSHFSLAKEAADWILSRKIFTQSKDRVAIVLFGTEEANNRNEKAGVFLQDEVLSRVNFDHLRYLNHEVTLNPRSVGNVIDALVIAADFLHEQTDGDTAVESKNILLFTNGLANGGKCKAEAAAVVNGLNAMEATLVVIGIDDSSSKHTGSLHVLLDIVKQTDGTSYSFRDAASALHHFTTPMVNSRAIRKNWEIAPGVHLPLALYTRTVAAKNPLKSVLVNEEGVEMHRHAQFSAPLKRKDVGIGTDAVEPRLKDISQEEKRIQVYYFGDTKVPIGEEDEMRYSHHNFNEGEQRGCLKLIQFTRRENLKYCYFIGRNSFVVVPGWEKKTSERDLEAARTTLSLISAMLENEVVAICRYAPDAAKHLQLMALIPYRDEEKDFVYLQGMRLPFAEDMRPFNFMNLSVSYPKPNHQQVNLIDELIEAMQFDSEKGAMEPGNVPNPFFQRQCTAMKLRALNHINCGEESKICDLIAPSTFLKRGLEPDLDLLRRAENVLSAMNSESAGFGLHEVVKVKKVKQEIREEDISEWLAELESVQDDVKPTIPPKDVEKRPHSRYIDRARARLSDNFEFHINSLMRELVVMISADDEEAGQLHEIAYGRLMSLRSLAVEFSRPTEFNEWLLISKEQWPEWARFCASDKAGQLTLISNAECASSEYSEKEAATIWNGCS